MRKRKKKYLALITAGFVAMGMNTDMIMAQNSTEKLEEHKEDIETEEQMEKGIFILENHGSFGRVELTYMDQQYTIKCDYAEYEIPMGTLCRLEVHPFSGYQTEFVKVNENLVTSETQVYELTIVENFTEVSIGYVKDPAMHHSTSSEIFKDNKVVEVDNPSVSAISNEVKVIYLDEKKDDSVLEENTDKMAADVVVEEQESQNSLDMVLEEIPADAKESKVLDKTATVTLIEENQNKEEREPEKRIVSEKQKKTEEMETQTKTKKEKSNPIVSNLSQTERTSIEISEKETALESKEVIFNFPLYLLIICCIVIVGYKQKWIKRLRYKWIKE